MTTTYYDVPLLKAPVWTWEVPVYFFIGGAAGGAAVIGAIASATYTGVLIGATTIPVWHEHVKTLPFHFAASGMGSAAAMLTLLGHDDPALNRISVGAAVVETVLGASIELNRRPSSRPLHEGTSGWVVRAGTVLSGPVPLVCRLATRSTRWRHVASVAALAGSLLTRIGWILAGRASKSA